MRRRQFIDQDVFGSDPAAIINDALARLLWPAYPRSQDPIGEHILIGVGPQPVKIVGVVADMHQNLETKPWPGVFRPYGQSPPPSAMLAVRTASDPLGFANAVRGQVQAIDPDQPVSAVRTMDNLIQAEVGPRTLMFKLLALFSGTALLITVVGIYGITRYWVVQRTRELGIRRALGAQEGNILGLVIGQGLGLAFGGVFIGVAGALALTRVMKAMLFDVSATDPSTFVGVGVLLMLLALIASYIPARRVTRIDPVTALRDG